MNDPYGMQGPQQSPYAAQDDAQSMGQSQEAMRQFLEMMQQLQAQKQAASSGGGGGGGFMSKFSGGGGSSSGGGGGYGGQGFG